MKHEPINLDKIPYTKWLEHTIRDLVNLPVKGICLNAVLENGDIYTAYNNVSMQNKITIAGLVQQDATIDSLAINGYINCNDEEDDSNGEEEE